MAQLTPSEMLTREVIGLARDTLSPKGVVSLPNSSPYGVLGGLKYKDIKSDIAIPSEINKMRNLNRLAPRISEPTWSKLYSVSKLACLSGYVSHGAHTETASILRTFPNLQSLCLIRVSVSNLGFWLFYLIVALFA